MKKIFTILFTLLSFSSFSHKGIIHKTKDKAKSKTSNKSVEESYEKINRDYIDNVKVIFANSCFNCHSSSTEYPWYYKFSFAKKVIDTDVEEAKIHLDLTNNFPFKGHGTPLQDLDAIKSSIDEDTMPPLRYKLLHPSSALSDNDKKAVYEWIQRAKKLLSH